MSLLPDPDALLALAARISAHAGLLRRHAHALAWSVAHTTWHGAAARTFATEAMTVSTALHRSADRLDGAATALRQHAARVRAALDHLARLAADAGEVGLGATRVLQDLAVDPARLGLDSRSLAGSAVRAGGGVVHAAGDVLDSLGL